MVSDLKQSQKKLYEADYHLWVEETVQKLKDEDFEHLDLENLIEEVADLSRREKKKLKNLLIRLFEHLLKLRYWDSERPLNQGHWEAEILNFRQQINDELLDSPSLKPYALEIYIECYQKGRALASTRSQLSIETFPTSPIETVDQVLDENWLP